MKKILLLLGILSLMGCEDKSYTLEVTFMNGQKDTLTTDVRHVPPKRKPYLDEGDLAYEGKVYASGVRRFKILNDNIVKENTND